MRPQVHLDVEIANPDDPTLSNRTRCLTDLGLVEARPAGAATSDLDPARPRLLGRAELSRSRLFFEDDAPGAVAAVGPLLAGLRPEAPLVVDVDAGAEIHVGEDSHLAAGEALARERHAPDPDRLGRGVLDLRRGVPRRVRLPGEQERYHHSEEGGEAHRLVHSGHLITPFRVVDYRISRWHLARNFTSAIACRS